jgi:hypothetical protein
VETHVKVLAILYIVISGFFALSALLLMFIFGGTSALVGATAPGDEAMVAIPIIGITGLALVTFLLALSLPGLIGGFGLLKRQNWARILLIVLSALNLINIPFGTILGAYGLWVLLNKDTERLFTPTTLST